MNNKTKSVLLKVLSVVGFLASATFTYKCYVGDSLLMEDKVLAIAMTLVSQASGIIFLMYSITAKSNSRRAVSFIISMLLFTLSIIATASYQTSKVNKDLNKATYTSQEYQMAVENRNLQLDNRKRAYDTIDYLKAELKDTKQYYKQQIDELVKEKKGTRLAWRKEQIDINMKNLQNKMAEAVKAQELELSNQIKNAQKESNKEVYEIKTDEIHLAVSGNLAFAGKIEHWLGWDQQKTSLMLDLLFAIIFEIAGIWLHVISFDYVDNVKEIVTKRKKNVRLKRLEKSVPAEPKGNFTEAQLSAYLKEMYKAKGKISEGYKKIYKRAGLGEGIGKAIYNHLKSKGIVKVIDGQTHIIKREDVELNEQN